MKTLENKIKTLINQKPLSIKGMSTTLGFTTKMCDLDNIEECVKWLRSSPKHSIHFLFDDGSFDGLIIKIEK